MEPGNALREWVLLFAIQTHTPVPYWLSLPIVELTQWQDTLLQLLPRRAK